MSSLLRPLIRDLALVALAAIAWQGAYRLEDAGMLAQVASALAGGALIAFAGYLAHEWGHLLGALAARSVVELPDRWGYVFLFKFDIGLNTRRQFLWMSAGGFIASALVVWLLLEALTTTRLVDQIALALVVLGVLATFVLEIPPAWRVLRGDPLPQQGPAFVNGADPPAR